MRCHHVISSSDLFAFSFTILFTFGLIINCCQHAAFTVFLRDGESPHFRVHVRRGFCRTLWNDADNKRHPHVLRTGRWFLVNFPRTNSIVCHSPCAVFCPHAQFLHSLWIPASGCAAAKEISTNVYIHVVDNLSKTSSQAPQAQIWTCTTWNFSSFFALVCFYGVHELQLMPYAIHAVKGRARVWMCSGFLNHHTLLLKVCNEIL